MSMFSINTSLLSVQKTFIMSMCNTVSVHLYEHGICIISFVIIYDCNFVIIYLESYFYVYTFVHYLSCCSIVDF